MYTSPTCTCCLSSSDRVFLPSCQPLTTNIIRTAFLNNSVCCSSSILCCYLILLLLYPQNLQHLPPLSACYFNGSILIKSTHAIKGERGLRLRLEGRAARLLFLTSSLPYWRLIPRGYCHIWRPSSLEGSSYHHQFCSAHAFMLCLKWAAIPFCWCRCKFH